MIWVCRWLLFGMVWVGKLLLSCNWCKSMTSQLPLCNVKRDHEYLPTYLPSKNNYLLWSPTKWTNRAEQYSRELNWFDLDGWSSFIHLLALYFRPSLQQPITTLLLRFAFVCNFVRSFGCGGAVAEALWMRCFFSPSPAFHTGTVLSFFFFFSPNPLSFRNCLFFFFFFWNSPFFPFKKEKTFSCCGFLHCFLCPFCSQICTHSS